MIHIVLLFFCISDNPIITIIQHADCARRGTACYRMWRLPGRRYAFGVNSKHNLKNAHLMNILENMQGKGGLFADF